MESKSRKKNFTDVFLKNLTNINKWPEAQQSQTFADLQTPGLLFQVKRNKNGLSALWRFRFYHKGDENLMSFGKYPYVSLSAARLKAQEARTMLADDINPIAAKKKSETSSPVHTFESVAKEWIASREKDWSEHYAHSVRQRLQNNVFAPIGSKDINALDLNDIIGALGVIIGRGSLETARRVCELILEVLTYARAIKALQDRNLIYDLAEYKTKAMPRHTPKHYPTLTDPEEIGRLLLALDGDYTEKGTYSVYMASRLAPYVFLRAGILCSLTWEEVNLEKQELVIGASRMKAGYAHIVPLAHQAVSLLEDMYNFSGSLEYVFPRHRNNKIPIVTDSLGKVLDRLGYEGKFVPHSWRSVASTLLNGGLDEGYGFEVPFFHPSLIEIQLAHVEKDEIAAAYYRVKENPRVRLKERREMLQTYADLLDHLKEEHRKSREST